FLFVYLPVPAQQPGRRPTGRRRLRGPVHPAQQGMYPRRQLPHRERLGQVVVRPDGQPDEQVGLVVACGEHEHRYRPPRLDPPAYLQPVEPGQHHIQYHQVRIRRRERAHRRRPVPGQRHLEPLGPQPRHQGPGDDRLVLHHHHTTLYRLRRALERQAPDEFWVSTESFGIDIRDLPPDGSFYVPDLIVMPERPTRPKVKYLTPAEVLLAVEVLSDSTKARDWGL